MNLIQEPAAMNSAMNLNQEYFIQPTGETIHYAKKCPPPPPPRTDPVGDWSTTPTETPQSRSGADAPTGARAPTGDEPTLSWSDVVLPDEPESLRHLTTPMLPAILHSRQGDDIVHPDIGHILIRQRGSYWWEKSQAKLEQQFSSSERQPVQGGFYVFLEEEQKGNIIRFGNVLTGVCWVMQTVAFPKGHPDADVPTYQMIDVRE